jgi:hypothetical protein
MRLKEFIDKNGNKVNIRSTGNTSKSTSSSGDYKKRLEKLIDYHIAHKNKDVVNYKKNINPYSCQYIEKHSGGIGGYIKELAVGFNIAGDWNFVVYIDNKKIDRKSGNGWEKFVYEISFYLALPHITSDPDYQELLEFVDSKGNKISLSSQKTPDKTPPSSSGYRERFKKLLDYATKHKSPEVVHINNTTISEDGFFYSVMKKEGISVRDFDINVYIRKSSEAWRMRIFWDNSLDSEITGTGYTNLLKELRKYITVPVAGTPEYRDLMFEDSRSTFTEWVDKNGNKVDLKNSSSQSAPKTNNEKFIYLLDYMQKRNKTSTVKTINKTEVVKVDDTGFIYKESITMNGIDCIVTLIVDFGSKYNSASTAWKYKLYLDNNLIEEIKGVGWGELLNSLKGNFHVPAQGSKEYESICESLDYSYADDFREYENLWD